MARILFGANPASGHVRPGLPVARELVARGHEVVWYASPRFRSSVERTGARLAPFRRGLDFDEADLDTSFPGRVGRSTIRQLQYDIRAMFIDTIPAHLKDLRALADESPMNLVVMESSFLAGAFLAEERRLPWAVYGITPLTMRSVDCAPMGFGLLPRDDVLGRLRHRALNWLVERVVFAAAQRRFQQVRAQVSLPPSEPFFLDHTSALAPVYLQGTSPWAAGDVARMALRGGVTLAPPRRQRAAAGRLREQRPDKADVGRQGMEQTQPHPVRERARSAAGSV